MSNSARCSQNSIGKAKLATVVAVSSEDFTITGLIGSTGLGLACSFFAGFVNTAIVASSTFAVAVAIANGVAVIFVGSISEIGL